jgi:hypothetical protein
MKLASSLTLGRVAVGFWYLWIALVAAPPASASAEGDPPEDKVRTRIVPLIF